MSEKNLKSLRFHGLDDIYKIPSTAEDVGAATLEQVNQAMRKAAPRNLLINSYFVNPVNQRGLMSYSGAKQYTIDKWYTANAELTVAIKDGYLQLVNGAASGRLSLAHYLLGNHAGKTYTAAACDYDTKMVWLSTFTFPEANGTNQYIGAGDHNGHTIRGMVTSTGEFAFQFMVANGKTLNVIWAALYEGEYTIDTLPEYQPKGYEYELLMCRQYDPNTGEYIGLRKFGQPVNLLDNSDFTNPVNQRGQDSYNGNVYGIDRWKGDSNDAVVTLLGDGITVMGDHLNQIISNSLSYAGKVLSFALCDSVGNIEVINTLIPAEINSNKWLIQAGKQFNFGLWVEKNGNIYACFKNAESSNPIVWAALYEGEYTLETLPEYQPKGYATEMAECRRYYYRVPFSWVGLTNLTRRSSTSFRGAIILPVPMVADGQHCEITNLGKTEGTVMVCESGNLVISEITFATKKHISFLTVKLAEPTDEKSGFLYGGANNCYLEVDTRM